MPIVKDEVHGRPRRAVLALACGAGRIQERLKTALDILHVPEIDERSDFRALAGIKVPSLAEMSDQEAANLADSIFRVYERIESSAAVFEEVS